MTYAFYSSPEYKEKQRVIAKKAWKKRFATFKYKIETRICARSDCHVSFTVAAYDPKAYCTQSCATRVVNLRRGKQSTETRKRIAASLQGRPSPWKGVIKIPRIVVPCKNPGCIKTFLIERWRKKKFCSIQCAMTVIGGQPTSPKASKGKNGVRYDISPTINFYSRWEANMARLYTYLNIRWEYAPVSFEIGGQKYTPDFYLPEENKYVEVKNFWWSYSKIRDEKFRKRYPAITLDVILKEQYEALEKKYAHLIPNWEYKNSKS